MRATHPRALAVVAFAVMVSVAAWAATSTEHAIEQRDKAFSQAEITLVAGDTLRVSNQDDVVHSLFARTDAYDIQEAQAPGAESVFEFPTEGQVEIRCAIHPTMVLKVTVE